MSAACRNEAGPAPAPKRASHSASSARRSSYCRRSTAASRSSVSTRAHRPHRVVHDVGAERAEGAERARRARDEHGGDADLARDERADHRPAPPGDQAEVAGIDGGARQDLGELRVHVRDGDPHDALGRFVGVILEPAREAGDGRFGQRPVQAHAPTEEAIQVEKPETRNASVSVASLPPRP
jgi:hypothetical protein